MASIARRRTPWPVHLVRLLVAVEVAFAGIGLVILGFFAAVGLFFSLGDFDGDGEIDTAGVVTGLLALLAPIALLLVFVRLSVSAAMRLDRDRLRARTTLVRLQWAVLTGLLLVIPFRDEWILGLVGTPVPLFVLLGCGCTALAALRRLRSGHPYSGPVPAPAPGSES